MKINKVTGRLCNTLFHASPHCDARPPHTTIDLIVIHNISLPPGQFSGEAVDHFFMGKLDPSAHPYFQTIADLRVSSHLFIRRTGQIIQYVPFHKRAWHAGESAFQGRTRCNDFSIGIELEGTDERPYEEAQYQQLACVGALLLNTYPIARDHIVGHETISPGRKTDPGPGFSWDYFHQLMEQR